MKDRGHLTPYCSGALARQSYEQSSKAARRWWVSGTNGWEVTNQVLPHGVAAGYILAMGPERDT